MREAQQIALREKKLVVMRICDRHLIALLQPNFGSAAMPTVMGKILLSSSFE
jgi:hypothetical protein